MKSPGLLQRSRAQQGADAPADVAVGMEQRAAEFHTRAIAFARALRKPPFHPETVHRLRTHLRRLQAYAEFLLRPRAATRLAQCVTWLSDLRSLYVFQTYLRRRSAPVEDVRRVDEAVRAEERAVASACRLDTIRKVLAELSIVRLRRPKTVLEWRLSALSREREDRLNAALRRLSPEATRKELHRLRLLIKSLRYQEEIAMETGWGRPHTVAALKRLQRTVGDYCDRAQFRRLAKEMDLKCRSEIKKDYRRYRQHARDAVRKLAPPDATPSGQP